MRRDTLPSHLAKSVSRDASFKAEQLISASEILQNTFLPVFINRSPSLHWFRSVHPLLVLNRLWAPQRSGSIPAHSGGAVYKATMNYQHVSNEFDYRAYILTVARIIMALSSILYEIHTAVGRIIMALSSNYHGSLLSNYHVSNGFRNRFIMFRFRLSNSLTS